MLFQPDFFGAAGRSVDVVEDLVKLEGFIERHQRFLSVKNRGHKVVNPVFAVRQFGNIEVDRLVAVGAVAEHARGIKTDSRVVAEKIDAVFARVTRHVAGPTGFKNNGAAALETEK